ncbi:MAG: cache domain-containing protein, partial [Magnetococcales bacterium]|nr:cache domain-containing protein [Magnetococcales bacterium]
MSDSAPISIRHSLRRTLFLWFLGLALLPLSIVSWLDHHQAIDALHTETIQKLTTAVELKSRAMEAFFSERTKDLQTQTLSRNNLRFFNTLQTTWQVGKLPPETFVRSYAWAELVEREGGDIKEFLTTYQYKNLLYMEPGGVVLFAAQPDPMLGTNLLTSPEKNSRAREVVRNALARKKAVFSDLEPGEEDTVKGYLAQPMLAENGIATGVLLLQINLDPLLELLENRGGLGETGETFLVGEDLLMRSNSRFQKGSSILKSRVDTRITRHWQQENKIARGERAGAIHHVIRVIPNTFPDYRGVEVLGIYADLEFLHPLDTEWVLIAKLDASEFHAPAIRLRNHSLIAVLLTGLLVLLAALGVARHMITPLQNLTRWAMKIQAGELTLETIRAPENEVGALVTAFG